MSALNTQYTAERYTIHKNYKCTVYKSYQMKPYKSVEDWLKPTTSTAKTPLIAFCPLTYLVSKLLLSRASGGDIDS